MESHFRQKSIFVDKLHSLYDLDLFNLNSGLNYDNSHIHNIISNYCSPHSFLKAKNHLLKSDNYFSVLYNNIRSLKKNLDNFESYLLDETDYQFDIIGIRKQCSSNEPKSEYSKLLLRIRSNAAIVRRLWNVHRQKTGLFSSRKDF